ncbi:GAF domain-containing protein [Candidatus Solirubrobacter pratensis]|uniref:GAF domain-containing protein n=1 Tax=Candidatus Solirubrobacter pratensis TaxID=1298857 RepID=UPI0003F756DB|nr:GAF domain-containing protein [Candidatus Solirubrobacter pratensis]
MRPRQIAPVALVLALTVAGFIAARLLTERDARRDSERRAEVAAAQIGGRLAQAASLTESLRRFMLDASGTGVTSDQFARNASRWLSPAGFPAAAWVERVPGSRRAAYERRIGQPIVTPDQRVSGSRSSYLPATLVSGFYPMAVPGTDLSGEPGMAAALARATRRDDVAGTPVEPPSTGTSGLFLVSPAPNLVAEVLDPGYVVVFVSDLTLRAAARGSPAVRIAAAGTSPESRAKTVSRTLAVAGQRFDVVVPRESVRDAAAVLPWLVLAAGLVLAALAVALGINGARRARAQEELDRIFTLSSDLIAVADFNGCFRRVNPAAEQILGYTEEELLSRPYLDFVHPDDRERTAVETAAIGQGNATLSFENRYVRKDGTLRVLEWQTTPIVEDGFVYAVARDVTERRQTETERERLAGEQAALRRVATLVARQAPQAEVFRAIAEEIAHTLGADEMWMLRYDGDLTAVVVGSSGGHDDALPVGSRLSLEADTAASRVFRTGHTASIDDSRAMSGPLAETARSIGIRSIVGAPIRVEGRLWGAMVAGTTRRHLLPPDTESRLGQFTELMATAIANTESRAEVERLAEEQAALRRVATLVAREAPQTEVFTAIAEEVGRLLGTEQARMLRYEDDRSVVLVASGGEAADALPIGARWELGGENIVSRVFRTGRPARLDDYGKTSSGPIGEAVRPVGISSVVGTPIMVEGRLWGAMVAGTSRDVPMPRGTESRLGQFTELMATAIAKTESHARADQLADEQAALRRVATLVAKEASLAEVFERVAEDVAKVFGDVDCALLRNDRDGNARVVAMWDADGSARFSVGTPVPLDGGGVVPAVLEEGRPARIDDYSDIVEPVGRRAEGLRIRSAVGCPIVVRGRLWGVMGVAKPEAGAFPPDTEARVAQFTELIATAIANAEARAEVERLADEQAALRRVATLVAQGVQPAELFSAVSVEVGRLFGSDLAAVSRFDSDPPSSVVVGSAKSTEAIAIGSRSAVDDETSAAQVYRTGRSARSDGEDWATVGDPTAVHALRAGAVSSVSSPIVVEGRLWGAVTVSARASLPVDTEERLEKFTELVATAIANAESGEALARLADEQAALRRVATLVAEGASPTAVFNALAGEMARLLDAQHVVVGRYEPGAELTVLALRGSSAHAVPAGARISHEGDSVEAVVRRTERSARMESYAGARGVIAELARAAGVRVAVGAPIVVDGRLWGVVSAGWNWEESPRADTEQRMAKFAQLLETAIANADSRDQLTASRARLVTAADEARRRVARDLHDGAQQRLVHTIVTLKLAQRALDQRDGQAASVVGDALEQAQHANAELRELAHGILPAALTSRGLRAGLEAFVARLDLPVEVETPAERFSAEIEASAYFIVAEALTNVVKHAHASRAEVVASVHDGMLELEVRDDGTGGADPGGHGVVGMSDRAAALGGRLKIDSPPGAGTLLTATLPLSGR